MNRLPRFSLRTVGLLVVAAALFLGWLASWERVARQKRLAAEAIQLAGGEVSWDVHRGLPPPPKTLVPTWLIKALGPEYFGNVECVTTATSTDAHLSHLAAFDSVELLEVHGSNVSDDGLRRLSNLDSVRDLRLSGLNLPPSGLAHFKKNQSLEILWLVDTNVKGQHLRDLADLTTVHWLIVEDDDFTNDDLLNLREANQLRTIQLGQTKVTADGVAKLAKYLPDCSISMSAGYFAPPDKRPGLGVGFVPGDGLWIRGRQTTQE